MTETKIEISATMRPTHLRCEYQRNPLGIETPQPRLYWQIDSQQRAQYQSAYQILVASSKELLASHQSDLWESGKVFSAQTTHIVYQGQRLQSATRYWWQVRVWDQDDTPSDFSEIASWEMGLLNRDDWQAQWISLPSSSQHTSPEEDGLVPSPYLRKPFHIHKELLAARLYVTSRGLYEIHLNGERVSETYFAPGWTDYHQRQLYQSYDVTTLMQTGENVLGALLGTGWYSGYVGFGRKCRHYGERLQLLAQLHLQYTDGSTQTLATDSTWKGTYGPILFSDLQMGETYDARQELLGWDTATYDQSGWQTVETTESGTVILHADIAPPVHVTEELTPVTITHLSPEVSIVDMGQNMVGWVRLHVQGAIGTSVQLRFAEMLNPDGTIYTENLRSARQTDTYILQGKETEEIFEPHFTFHGFRYIEVRGYPGELVPEAIRARVAHSDTPLQGHLKTGNPLVNQLQSNILWGQRGNFLSVPTDCPQRDERLGWMGDAQIFVRTACYNMDVATFFTKWMDDVQDAQTEEGGFTDTAPRLAEWGNGAPAWADAGIIVPWTIYRMYGDTRIIERHYDAMVRWITYIEQGNPQFLRTERLNANFGDWLSIEADTPRDVLATAYFAYDAQLLSQMARALGRHEDAERYQHLFENIKEAFGKAYVSADGKVKGETQTCYLLALFMDLLAPEVRPLAAQHLVADIEKRNWHLSTGFVGVGYLCPTLTEIGRTDVAYRLLLNETFPSWGYSIKHGATTIWERWDGWTEERGFQDPGMNSFNHYSLGSVGQWLYQYVAGIDVESSEVGFQQIFLHPNPDKALGSMRAEYESLHGKIISHWTYQNETFTYHVTLPANTRARVVLPIPDQSELLEEGKPLGQSRGVAFQRYEQGTAHFELASGSYEFTVHR